MKVLLYISFGSRITQLTLDVRMSTCHMTSNKSKIETLLQEFNEHFSSIHEQARKK